MKRSRKSEDVNAEVNGSHVQAWTKKVGQAVAKHRDELGWSQDALAAAAGVTRTTVIGLENGNRSVGLDAILRCLLAMNVDIWKLFGGPAKQAPQIPIDQSIVLDQLKELIALKASTDPKKKRAADWISGNIETFHELYVRKR